MTSDFAEMWTDVAGFGPEQQETMRTGGYYSIEALPGLRVISFNTNYWLVFASAKHAYAALQSRHKQKIRCAGCLPHKF